MEDTLFAGIGIIGGLAYLAIALLWILVPIFIFLISKRVKDMRDIARESRLEVKELNANLKALKRKLNEEEGEKYCKTVEKRSELTLIVWNKNRFNR